MTGPTALGMPPALRSAIVWTLTDAGFPRTDAEAWADGWSSRPDPALVAHQAIAYDDHGIPIAQAIEWHQRGFYAAEATCFYDRRYTPTQAATVCGLVEDDADIDEWLATGLPASRVIAYLRAHVNLDEIGAYEAAPDGAEEALGLLAGLLG